MSPTLAYCGWQKLLTESRYFSTRPWGKCSIKITELLLPTSEGCPHIWSWGISAGGNKMNAYGGGRTGGGYSSGTGKMSITKWFLGPRNCPSGLEMSQVNWEGRQGGWGGGDGSISSVFLRTAGAVPPFFRLPAAYCSAAASAFSAPRVQFAGCCRHTKQKWEVPRRVNKFMLSALFPESITCSLLQGNELSSAELGTEAYHGGCCLLTACHQRAAGGSATTMKLHFLAENTQFTSLQEVLEWWYCEILNPKHDLLSQKSIFKTAWFFPLSF